MPERIYRSFETSTADTVLHQKVLGWISGRFDTVAFLHSNGYAADRYGAFPWIIAAGGGDVFQPGGKDVFEQLKGFADAHADWIFGFFSYELKNRLERLGSSNPDRIGMPECHFFRPVIVVLPETQGLRIGCLAGFGKYSDPQYVFERIMEAPPALLQASGPVVIRRRVDRDRYLNRFRRIKDHIQQGDIYEMNYCIEFFAENATLDPLSAYMALNALSQTPFSCFYLVDGMSLACASPERFLRKIGRRLVSQPIKGTIARGSDRKGDDLLKQQLYHDPKERSENVMIVDLVRNDLSRSAAKGSVRVEELFGVYSFRQVNQMISTVTARLHPEVHYLDAIKHAFPMGSMTGAPKVRAMELIDEFEDTQRGLYSGSVGYISPGKDFDFNVVIRSTLYNAERKYLSFMAGSAITIGSDGEKEYEECLLKARAMGESIGGQW